MSRKSITRIIATQNQFEMLQNDSGDPPDYPNLQQIRDLQRRREKQQANLFSFFNYLIVLSVIVAFLYVVSMLKGATDYRENSKNSSSKNLLLTPLINAGNILEARALANVTLFPGIISYSGFLTVDEDCKSHLFFWFFPAASGNSSAPLLLWHGGGPGTSGLLAMFQGTGPINLDEEAESWSDNRASWSQHRSVLYLDSPVGSGFSYTEKGDLCYAFSGDDVADGAIEALRQFYTLFQEYQSSDLYICSSSYGGKLAPTIAWRIEVDNQVDHMNGNSSSINLKGIISISGFSDPINQIDYGDFYYNMGIIDETQLKYFKSEESLAKSFINAKNPYQAYTIIDPLIIGGSNGEPSYLKNNTGISHLQNFVSDLAHPNISIYLHRYEKFLNKKWVQDLIHVNTESIGHSFRSSSNVVYNNLVGDLYKSVSNRIEYLLECGYKFLFTSGQLDLIVPHTTSAKFLHELRWQGSKEFSLKQTSRWVYNGNVVGYEKTVSNLTYVMVRNAGHHLFVDKPYLVLDLVLTFTR